MVLGSSPSQLTIFPHRRIDYTSASRILTVTRHFCIKNPSHNFAVFILVIRVLTSILITGNYHFFSKIYLMRKMDAMENCDGYKNVRFAARGFTSPRWFLNAFVTDVPLFFSKMSSITIGAAYSRPNNLRMRGREWN